MGTITKPWIPFSDYQDHVTLAIPVMNIHPELELSRASFAERQALGLLLTMGEHETSASDRAKCAVCLAKLSGKVMCRRRILTGVLDGNMPIPGPIRDQLEQAVHHYWIIAKMANILHLIPGAKMALSWAVTMARTQPRVSEKKRVCAPWRSEALTDAMEDRYRARETFSFKIWEMRFPSWMKASSHLDILSMDQKTPDDQA